MYKSEDGSSSSGSGKTGVRRMDGSGGGRLRKGSSLIPG